MGKLAISTNFTACEFFSLKQNSLNPWVSQVNIVSPLLMIWILKLAFDRIFLYCKCIIITNIFFKKHTHRAQA